MANVVVPLPVKTPDPTTIFSLMTTTYATLTTAH